MKDLQKFKQELQEHQIVNTKMIKWAKEKGDNKCAEKWRNKVVECDYILFLIDDFIKQRKRETKSLEIMRKTNRKLNEIMEKTDKNLQKLNKLYE